MRVQSEELSQTQQQLAALKEHIRSSDQQGIPPSDKGAIGGGNSAGGSSSSSNDTEKVVKELEVKLSETVALKDKAEAKAKLAVDKIKARLLFEFVAPL